MGQDKNNDLLGIYLHIPFCQTKCNYCDFNTYSGIENQFENISLSLQNEIIYWSERLGSPKIHSIFLGGGTPSYLPEDLKERIFNTIYKYFNLSECNEITMETNPDDVSEQKINNWKDFGINRISLGVQTFNDKLLKSIGRRHDSLQAKKSIEIIRKYFDNFNIDLMFGLPDQTINDWEQSLNFSINSGATHLSLYGLQLEEGTPLNSEVKKGYKTVPNDDLTAEMYSKACKNLNLTKYDQYEISNWSLKNYQCKHNLIYWKNHEYIGCGPGASSYINGYRFKNIKSPVIYSKKFNKQMKAPNNLDIKNSEGAIFEIEKQTVTIKALETIMLGLRLNTGISDKFFSKKVGKSMYQLYNEQIKKLSNLGLIKEKENTIKLTHKGKLLANEVISHFII